MNCIWRHQRRLQSWMITVWLERLLYDLLFAGFFFIIYMTQIEWFQMEVVVVVHFEYKKFLEFFSQIYSQANSNSTRSSTTTQAKRFKWSENEHKKNASLKEREREENKMERRRWQVINKKTSFSLVFISLKAFCWAARWAKTLKSSLNSSIKCYFNHNSEIKN